MDQDVSPARVGSDMPGDTGPNLASLWLAASIASIAWVAFAAQTVVTVDRLTARGYGVIDGLERMTSYLTNLTVFVSALCFTFVAMRRGGPVARFFRQPAVITAVVAYMAFVGVAYNVLLRYLWTPSGYRAVLNECLHSVVPALAALYWMRYVPRFQPTVRQCLLSLAYPVCYLSVTLWRGSTTDFYPYPFIDVDALGIWRVFSNVTLLMLGFVLLMGTLLAINLRRPSP